jgi:general secretion pathway protein C
MARYFTIIQLALIVAITYFGTFIFYRVLTEKLETVPVFQASSDKQVIPPTQPSEKNSGSFKQYQTAIDRNLFKATSTEPVKKDEKVDLNTLQQTQLGLKLWGTVYGMAGKTYAVIEETATRKQHLFSIGDEVQSASVEMILREKVVLGVKGKKEILKIEKPAGGRGRVATKRESRTSAPVPEESGAKDGKEVVIQRSRIDDAIQNVNQLMRHVRIRPHFTNGQPDGLKLTGVRPGSIFTDIGFRNGDIITGVNGKPIESVDDALKFYSSLKSADNVDLQIRRRGADQTIQYRVED